jgi:uncharacterized SAM-binding protein YcdF (DUF218 family)
VIVPRVVVITAVIALLILGGCVVISTVAMAGMRAQMWQMYKDCPLKPPHSGTQQP